MSQPPLLCPLHTRNTARTAQCETGPPAAHSISRLNERISRPCHRQPPHQSWYENDRAAVAELLKWQACSATSVARGSNLRAHLCRLPSLYHQRLLSEWQGHLHRWGSNASVSTAPRLSLTSFCLLPPKGQSHLQVQLIVTSESLLT